MNDPLSIPAPHTAPKPILPTRRLLQPSHDHPDDYTLELDFSHGLAPFMVCPRQWENLNIHSRQSAYDNTAQSFGTLFHKCEELRLRHGFSKELQAAQFELIAKHFLTSPVPPDEYRNADRMMQVIAKYNAMNFADGWPEAIVQREGEKVLERAFKVPLCTIELNTQVPYWHHQLVASTQAERGLAIKAVGGSTSTYIRNLHILLTGRLDGILSNSNLLFVLDHKTTSRDEKEVTDAFHLSFQTRGYAWAATKLGFPVAGCIINSILVRPPAKTERAQKPREEFTRHTYFYRPDSLDEWEASVRAHLSSLVHYLTTGFFPQVGLSFRSPCPRCDYHENCKLPPHQRQADLQSALYQDVTWSPIHE